ncbi:MAG: hypothetical protein FJX00_03290 [Alphaproteobacteria bacterium]|nr:hypothetical protein [Alphaproteobacteria bacterium]
MHQKLADHPGIGFIQETTAAQDQRLCVNPCCIGFFRSPKTNFFDRSVVLPIRHLQASFYENTFNTFLPYV